MQKYDAPKPSTRLSERTIFGGRRSVGTSEKSYQNLKLTIHRCIVDEMSNEEQFALTDPSHSHEEVEDIITGYCHRVMDKNPALVSRSDCFQIFSDICDEILGLGSITPLLKDNSITEIMVNGSKKTFVEQKVKLHLKTLQFHYDAHLMNIIVRALTPLGRCVDETSLFIDARLDDGSRVNIIIPPLSLVGSIVTIRKYSQRRHLVFKI